VSQKISGKNSYKFGNHIFITMSARRKLVLIFDSEDYSSPKELLRTIGYALREFHSEEFQNEITGLPPLKKDLIIQINQRV
jgi:hypothetical protein